MLLWVYLHSSTELQSLRDFGLKKAFFDILNFTEISCRQTVFSFQHFFENDELKTENYFVPLWLKKLNHNTFIIMATVTLNYDGRSTLIKSILNSAVLAGATQVAHQELSPLDIALEDVRLGRVTTICKPKYAKKVS